MKRTKRNSRKKEEEEEVPVVGFKRGFRPPNESEREEAVGKFPPGTRPAIPAEFQSSSIEDEDEESGIRKRWFEPLRVPTHENDWLAQFNESRQSVLSFRRTRPLSHAGRESLYLLPIGDLRSAEWIIGPVVEFARVFLGPVFSKVDQLPPVPIGTRIKTRVAHRYHVKDYLPSHVQVCVDDLVPSILGSRPRDSRTVIGITMVDLHMDSTDEFTVGAASPDHGVGCFSFARYDPRFDVSSRPADWPGRDAAASFPETQRRKVMLARCCKVFVHEVMHLLGFAHCVYWSCLMNGSGRVDEDDSQPLRLCPVDIRKLKIAADSRETATGEFDAVGWLRGIGEFLSRHEILEQEVKWINERVDFIERERKRAKEEGGAERPPARKRRARS